MLSGKFYILHLLSSLSLHPRSLYLWALFVEHYVLSDAELR